MSRLLAWKCEVCGYVHRGSEAPGCCPICGVAGERFAPLTITLAEPLSFRLPGFPGRI